MNAISPGFILTPMPQRAIDCGLFPLPYRHMVASYRIPRVEREAAAAIGIFVSEDAGYFTGQALGVNGGCYLRDGSTHVSVRSTRQPTLSIPVAAIPAIGEHQEYSDFDPTVAPGAPCITP